MSTTLPDDILLPTLPNATDNRPSRSRIVAFVPITIAIIGVAAILVGKVTVNEIANSDVLDRTDPVVTGTIATGSSSQQSPVR
jgi:hypothetical protein